MRTPIPAYFNLINSRAIDAVADFAPTAGFNEKEPFCFTLKSSMGKRRGLAEAAVRHVVCAKLPCPGPKSNGVRTTVSPHTYHWSIYLPNCKW